jgi:ABC-type sugar transport system permease subunit
MGSRAVTSRRRKGVGGGVSSKAYLLALSILPLAWAILLAFFDYSPRRVGEPFFGLGGENPFVGLQYFITMFTGEGCDGLLFQNSLRNTAYSIMHTRFLACLP